MKLQGKIKDISLDYVMHQPLLTIQLNNQLDLLTEEFNKLKDNENLDISIAIHREKRSLNANNYAWKIITEIADVLRASKEEIYLTMLKRYGQSELVSVLSSIDVSGYFKYYEVAGTSILNEKEFRHYKVYKGSSEFDTREMSILIDGIVSEAKELGINTATPDEIAKMKAMWIPSI